MVQLSHKIVMGMKILNKKYFESMKKYRDDNNLQNELTDDGKDILYERVGTVTHSDGETIIDVYNIYSKKILGKKKLLLYIFLDMDMKIL